MPTPKLIRDSRETSAQPSAPSASLATFANWLGIAIVLGAGVFSLYVTQVSSVATAGYEMARLEAERAGWLARNQQLELELAKRRSLAWAEIQAVQRLGMVHGERPTFVTVDVHPLNAQVAIDSSSPQAARRAPATAPVSRAEPAELGRLWEGLTTWIVASATALP